MKRAIISLMLIATMVFSASIAMAQNFSASGNISPANGWATTGAWENIPGSGSYTESAATASHAVVTGPSGAFNYQVKFKIADAANYVKIGLQAAGGRTYAIEYNNGNFWFDGASLGPNNFVPTATHSAKIYSDDGNVWHVEMAGYLVDVNVGKVPAGISLALTKNAAVYAPVIYSVDFTSAGGSATPTPTPGGQPGTGSGPSYDPQEVQDFYNDVYPMIGSPYDTVTRNADGTFTVAKGYPPRTGKAATGFSVAGAVTAAADGKPISGATVVFGNDIQKTGADGQYKFANVIKGNYDIAVSAAGFASRTQSLDVKEDVQLDIALVAAVAGGTSTASAANESVNVTATPAAPTGQPVATRTQSPGFEAVFAAIAVIGSAGALVYLNRKR